MARFVSELTDFNGRRLSCGPVHDWTFHSFVFSCERELGNCGSTEEEEGEGREQHVKESVDVVLYVSNGDPDLRVAGCCPLFLCVVMSQD